MGLWLQRVKVYAGGAKAWRQEQEAEGSHPDHKQKTEPELEMVSL